VSTPNAAKQTGDYDSLQGVATVSTSNAWAVGYSGNVNAFVDQTLIEHWNGSSWHLVSGANPKADKILSMYQLSFEEALRGSLQEAPPTKEPKEQKKQAPRQQKRTTGKRTHKQS